MTPCGGGANQVKIIRLGSRLTASKEKHHLTATQIPQNMFHLELNVHANDPSGH